MGPTPERIGRIGFSAGAFLVADVAVGFGLIKQGLPVDRWIYLLSDGLKDQGF